MSEIVQEVSLEEGECSSEDELAGYTPIERPTDLNRRPQHHQPIQDDSDSDNEGPLGHPGTASDSDSDEEKPTAKKRTLAGPWGRRHAIVPDSGNNEAFKMAAAAFQAERKKDKRKNNVWGSLIQEDALNADLSGIGVKRSIKDLGSDRGAESYDFNIPLEIAEKERQRKKKEMADKNEMDDYWSQTNSENTEVKMEDDQETKNKETEKENLNSKNHSDRRGTKRSAKDRLGNYRVPIDRYHGQKLAVPGEAKHLINISDEDLLECSEREFASILAERLGEEKPELVEGFVTKFGKTVAHNVYKLTQKKEIEGGIEINNGARRRTSGGVFFFLIKSDPSCGVDVAQVKKFLADFKRQEDRKILEAKSRKKKKDYDKEMQDFLELRKEVKVKQDAENVKSEEVDMEPADQGDTTDVKEEKLEVFSGGIFSNVVKHLKNEKNSPPKTRDTGVTSKPSTDPEVPPNSVERPLQSYDDELFADTENIEFM